MFSFLKAMPEAHATISGNSNYPDLKGTVSFYEVHGGTVVAAEIQNLPKENHFHGFHIHAGGSCTGTKEEPLKMQRNIIIRLVWNIQIMLGIYHHYYLMMERHLVCFIQIVFFQKI